MQTEPPDERGPVETIVGQIKIDERYVDRLPIECTKEVVDLETFARSSKSAWSRRYVATPSETIG
jgi:hypothetical protein